MPVGIYTYSVTNTPLLNPLFYTDKIKPIWETALLKLSGREYLWVMPGHLS